MRSEACAHHEHTWKNGLASIGWNPIPNRRYMISRRRQRTGNDRYHDEAAIFQYKTLIDKSARTCSSAPTTIRVAVPCELKRLQRTASFKLIALEKTCHPEARAFCGLK